MKTIKITVVKKIEHKDLIDKYEALDDSVPHCNMNVGLEFISIDANKPAGLCDSAWISIQPYVFALANGATDFYDGWMKNKTSAMISCNDGFRPVSFYIEVI